MTMLQLMGVAAAEPADMETQDEDIKSYSLGDTIVTASAINDDDIIAGGMTARSADYGVLGTRDTMSTPFNMTTFTSDMIVNRQAR